MCSWATVHVSSSRPVPYTLGYVDLPRELRVLALIGGDPAGLRIGQPVELLVGDGGWTFVVAALEAAGE
ncbi:MAG: OB-fold domain-containing protein [Trebonia sp.]